ncbi:translation initiation factor IF-2 [Candidatus Endolissoclinum faulkneri L2]|uniref:Translation initiation factor IF-2 n=1 Tax=Candidatus Endolissoclinum faulkneri L2 TaxID=1193729 RepID=K7YFB8_9PROT|nr:translation initiation factor IF-2 [Candidatus Endolissoclinum faulkneri L2]
MSSTNEQDRKKLSLGSNKDTLSLGKSVETAQVKQSFSHGRSKTVQVEVRRRRMFNTPSGSTNKTKSRGSKQSGRELTAEEREVRSRVLEQAVTKRPKNQLDVVNRVTLLTDSNVNVLTDPLKIGTPQSGLAPVNRRQAEMDELRKIEDAEAEIKAIEAARIAEGEANRQAKAAAERATARLDRENTAGIDINDEGRRKRGGSTKESSLKRPSPRTRSSSGEQSRRRQGKLTISDALSDDSWRMRSLASVRRARERERQRGRGNQGETIRQSRDVIVPETITVQELANRMAERGGEVIKTLMKMGFLATINQMIDADTAELVAQALGHKVRRVAESDVELGMTGEEDSYADLQPRPPVVTVMGHVDHGKTSLLDAIRQADVASSEAGGITQHIGAHQIELPSRDKITLIDTPGHESFTEMRARGANVTDIVLLVVAADDGIMAQTIEAIHHAKAANVPIIVAVNKIDKPEANPQRVRTDLLQHAIVVEDMGGEVQAIDVSAQTKHGLSLLLEAIVVQAEILELKANPNRAAAGIVIEAKVERGRGSVATVLVQRGTLRTGNVFVAGAEWGRVRALVNDRGKSAEIASPSDPIEVLGLQGTPIAGDDFVVVENENRAREIADYRQRRLREKSATIGNRSTVEQMLSAIKSSEAAELPLVIKTDVHGSLEAIRASIEKLENRLVKPRILHAAVGGISESDVSLASASGGIVVGFNVRANPQAREMARRDGMELRYYSIIYDLIDDMKTLLTGMLAPELNEEFLGYAEIRQIFNISKVGKVAGCMVMEGIVKRSCKVVRLLRDNVVIHEGSMKTLKRFKEEVREVREGYECGIAFENYDDIREGDQIECLNLKEVARTLEQVQQQASA